mmetsp:Transcript_15036/g.23268  ORF Transcript_15036/g.23268 Transcript_15036/m.23268 type:complete len:104 (+) Transcript_15036:4560-4871(+)
MYKVQGIDNLEDNLNEGNMPSNVMNRFKVDKMVNHSKKAVLKDNVQQVETYLKEISYIDRLMESYSTSRKITLEELAKITVGKMLLTKKAELQEAARKIQRKI